MKKRSKMTVLLLAAAAALGVGSRAVAAYDARSGAYDRRGTVAEEERGTISDLPMVGAPEVSPAPSPTPHPNAWRRVNGVCYNGSGVAVPGAITRGIDVSEWQGQINWAQVKRSDVDFAFVRISYGLDYMDKTYDYNMKSANASGVPVGTYVYSTATTQEQALQEAQMAIRKMRGYTISYPVVYDVEYSAMKELTSLELSEQILTFCNEIKKAGYYPMVYTNVDWYRNYINMSMLSGVDIWLASYGDRINAPNRNTYRYSIWQCTDGDGGGTMNPTKGLVAGIPSQNNVDLNYGFVDYTALIQPRSSARSDYEPTEDVTSGYTGWVTNGDKTYYYRDGEMLRGSQDIGGQNYRFSQADGHLFRDMILSSATTGKVVYVDPDGVRVSNTWITREGKTYYFGADGNAYKGHQKVGEEYYYFNTVTGVCYQDYLLRTTGGFVYYFNADGVRVRNAFATVKDRLTGESMTYYFGSTGNAYKGWHVVRHRKYFFYTGTGYRAGTMARNTTLKIGRTTYTFNARGQVTGRTGTQALH